jgi:hypothetical protein
MSKRLILGGRRFGNLLVLESAGTLIYGNARSGRSMWRCLCDCGKERTIASNSLTSGLTVSCGCHRNSLLIRRNKINKHIKHGMTGTPEWCAFKDARHRCMKSTNPRWKDYGGRGIKFLFKNFEHFFSELGLRTSPDHSLDRVNNDGHYEPGNVKWSTAHEQRINQRSSS